MITNLREYFSNLQNQLAVLLKVYSSLQKKVLDNSTLHDNLPSVGNVVTRVGGFFSLIGGVFLLIVFFSIVIYMLISPEPLIEAYLTFFKPSKRTKAAQALAKSSKMMVGWMWSNLVVGTLEAIAVFFFLNFMDLPGVWVWAGLALFAEMVPKLGLYIMAIPPCVDRFIH